ncbi:GNAT family N-acetyltransferase [Roseibium hamelinense]|nr:GNAT family N-acetyltransferase [Roseibium hamelinense]
MLYRHLVPDDVPARPEVQARTFTDMLNHAGLTIFIGTLNGSPICSCTLIMVPNFTRGCAPYGFIENVVTHADFRSCGYGDRMMQSVFAHAFAEGAYKLMLLAGSDNKKGHRFYERAGFQRTKTGFEIRAPGYPKRTVF